jgi:hypothetical protein
MRRGWRTLPPFCLGPPTSLARCRREWAVNPITRSRNHPMLSHPSVTHITARRRDLPHHELTLAEVRVKCASRISLQSAPFFPIPTRSSTVHGRAMTIPCASINLPRSIDRSRARKSFRSSISSISSIDPNRSIRRLTARQLERSFLFFPHYVPDRYARETQRRADTGQRWRKLS